MPYSPKQIREILTQPHELECNSQGWRESVKMDFCDCFIFDAWAYFDDTEK